MRQTICAGFYGLLPSALRNAIANTTKYTDNAGGTTQRATDVTATTDKVFVPALHEVNGTDSSANAYENNYQAVYSYYSNGNSNIKYRSDDLSEQAIYRLRSPNGAYGFSIIDPGGSGASRADNSYGFVPCFKVG